MFFTVAVFYTYSGILGSNDLRADIAIFYLSAAFLTCFVRYKADGQRKSSLPGLLILLALTGCFLFFTYFPPTLGLFLG
jgi:hypothetical protein